MRSTIVHGWDSTKAACPSIPPTRDVAGTGTDRTPYLVKVISTFPRDEPPHPHPNRKSRSNFFTWLRRTLMFMVAIILAVLLIAGVFAIIVTRKNHDTRAGGSGLAEATEQTHGNSGPKLGRSHTGAD